MLWLMPDSSLSARDRGFLLAEPRVVALSVSAGQGRRTRTLPIFYQYTSGQLSVAYLLHHHDGLDSQYLKGVAPLIPDLAASTGHLPLGRYHATLSEVHSRFVVHSDFEGSPTREAIWQGFIAYMAAWGCLEDTMAPYLGGERLILTTWLAGSFVSSKFDPDNLDLTLLIDGERAASCQGKPGINQLKKLTYRDGMLEVFKVSPCLIRYHYFRSPFLQHIVGRPEVQEYVVLRGAFDDFWQRARPEGLPKGEPTPATAAARRGYLEVEA
jgi:hypothetical protein